MSETINNSKLRVGNFTSSEIVHLMSDGKGAGTFGKPFYTYLEECNFERKLGRPLTDEINARPLTWGRLVERRCFDVLGLEYKLCSAETIGHLTIDYWAGSPDAEKFDEGKTVIDIKCPMTLKSFCTLADCVDIEQVREKHKEGDKYYWQIVSNAILTGASYGELIVYVPYQSELKEIREMASNVDSEYQYKYFWIANAQDEELPYVLDGGNYKNVNVIRFVIPDSDKAALTERVKAAGKYLIERSK